MIGFALCHGWSFDSRVLTPLQEALKQRFPQAPCPVFDLGFTGKEQIPDLPQSIDWIAVGHSYGFAWMMRRPHSWKAAISLNGFTRFCRQTGRPEGTPFRIVDAMLKRVADAPRETVEEFQRRCGMQDTAHGNLDREHLLEHLALLRDLDLPAPPCPTLALASVDDPIVPIELARICFGYPHCILHETQGDHIRLLTAPQQYIDLIAGFVEGLDG
jgi:pimeloyl-[acyl-carrier protein] methyl ester esterase